MVMIDPNDYPDPHCYVCHIPECLAMSMTKTDDGRWLCEQCIETNKDAIKSQLFQKLLEMEKELKKQIMNEIGVLRAENTSKRNTIVQIRCDIVENKKKMAELKNRLVSEK